SVARPMVSTRFIASPSRQYPPPRSRTRPLRTRSRSMPCGGNGMPPVPREVAELRRGSGVRICSLHRLQNEAGDVPPCAFADGSIFGSYPPDIAEVTHLCAFAKDGPEQHQ